MLAEEQKIIRRVKNGDREAANKLLDHYYNEIYAFVYRQTASRELSMDLTQEIMIAVLQSIPSYHSKKAGFRTWLYRIASNKIVDYYRSSAHRFTSVSDELTEALVDPGRLPEPWLEEKETLLKITAFIGGMEEQVQMVVRLKLFSGYQFNEIAAMTKTPESTVKTRYYSAIHKIRKEMGEDEY